MRIYIFATYVDCREEWAIRADNLEHARKLIGGETNGTWRKDAVHLDTEPVEARELVLDFDDETPLVEDITPGHWAWRDAHRDAIERSLKQNIAAISGDFHTHRLCDAFYEAFGELIDGFVGQYELCIAMAEALTDWETANGLSEAYENAGVPWIEVVEDFVETVLETALDTGFADPAEHPGPGRLADRRLKGRGPRALTVAIPSGIATVLSPIFGAFPLSSGMVPDRSSPFREAPAERANKPGAPAWHRL